MDKKSFYRWLNTASTSELATRKVAILDLLDGKLGDADVRRQARWMVKEIEMETLARTEADQVS